MRIDISEFGLQEGQEADAALAVFRALAASRTADNPELVFPKGSYHFFPERAAEGSYYITNHDQGGTRRTAFPILNRNGLIIDGQGSEFIFHGPMIPFILDNSANITLRNFTIDWARPMFEQGIVTAASETSFDIQLAANADYEMRSDGLYFEFGGGRLPVWGFHDIDPINRTHAHQSGDRISWNSFKKLKLSEAGPGLIRVTGDIRHIPRVGNRITMRFGRRENPGIFIKGSDKVEIGNVTLHHAPGMGLVAQRSSDITLRGFDVRLNPDSGRMVTATADATHFTNCRGTILIEDCLFENQLDDPCNVHGIYVRVSERISEDTLLVRFMHEMTVGIDFTGMGDIVRFINNESLLPYAEASVRSAELVNEEYMLITFDQPLPSAVGEYHVIENVTWNPDLTVRRCTVRANRARGFLITTPGRVLLEHNTISAPGAGIKISGDANSWYESGAVQDVTIRYNTFLDCNYCYPDWGRAVIDIDPEIENPESHEECYHRNIRIQENVFDTFESPLVYGHSIDGFTFTGNVVRRSGNYPMHGGRPYTIELRAARNTVITGNRFEGGEPRAALLENAEVNLPVES